MSIPQPSKLRAGFTLVELLIVVIILAILAAIVIPQFSSATRDTQESALDANLAGLRNAIELYKVQHNTWPGAVATTGGAGCTGTLGTGAAGSDLAFKESLTMYSNRQGQTCSNQEATYKFGPYIRKAMPIEPVSDKADVVVTSSGGPVTPTADTGGWAYDTVSGKIIVNSNALDTKQAAYHLR